jgi:hypothetical protein
MDAKITLSFDETAISKAKKYAEENNISLSRLTEFLYNKVTSGHHTALEDYPIADWVNMLSEGEVEYQRQPKGRKKLSAEYFKNIK